MNLNEHIFAAMREQIERWEALLDRLNEKEISAPLLPSQWSVKDELAHLMAWQQRSIARVQAALSGREPEFPRWLPGVDAEDEDATDQINAWIYETYRKQSWAEVHSSWKTGFLRFLELGREIPEKDLLDSGRYAWLGGYPLAIVFMSSYDHHQEHLEKLLAWLEERGSSRAA